MRVREGENFDDVYAKRMTSEIVKMEIYVSRALAPAKVEQCSLLHARARASISPAGMYTSACYLKQIFVFTAGGGYSCGFIFQLISPPAL